MFAMNTRRMFVGDGVDPSSRVSGWRTPFFAVLLALALVAGACGTDEPVADEPAAAVEEPAEEEDAGLSGTVTMLRGPFSADDSVWEDQLVADFNEMHPNVVIDNQTYDWGAADAEIAAAFASGAPPDVI